MNEGRVEGAAAEIVDDDVLALRGDGVAVAVGVLKACSGGLVEERDNLEARSVEGVDGEESLRAVGVRRRGHHGDELIVLRAALRPVGAREDGLPERA